MRVSLPCCETFEDYDRSIHCQHIHFISGEASYRHRKCCQHPGCVRRREEE